MRVQQPGEPGRPAGTVTGLMLGTCDARSAEESRRGGNAYDGPRKAPGGPDCAAVADADGNEHLLIQRDRPLPGP
jgi:hypothetical protein